MRLRGEQTGAPAHAIAWCSPLLCLAVSAVILLGLVAGATISTSTFAQAFDESFLRLAIRTLLVSLAIGLIATLLALPWAWALGTRAPRGLGVLAMTPLLLPTYLVYAAWSLLRAPGTWLGDRLATASVGALEFANFAQAVLSLALWSWPLAVIALVPAVRAMGREALDALAITPSSRAQRARLIARELRTGLVGSVAIVAIVMAGSAVPLHVAQVETYAIATWRAIAEGRTANGLLAPAIPALLLAAAGSMLALRMLLKRDHTDSQGSRPQRRSRVAMTLSILVLAVAVGGPLVLFARAMPAGDPVAQFLSLSSASLARSAELGLVVGLAGVLIAVSTAFAAHARTPLASGAIWIIFALVPGVLIGSAVARASVAHTPLDALGRTSAGLALAHVARFGAVAWIVGVLLASREHRDLRGARRVFWSGSFASWLASFGPARLAGASGGVLLAVALLSFHEIEAAVVAAPAGVQPFARQMLSWLHYLRDDALTTGAFLLGAFGLIVALLAMLLLRMGLRRTANLAACLAPLALLGCDDSGVDAEGRILNTSVIGHVGRGDGAFIYPRAIDTHDGTMWIIDKTARVQQLTTAGETVRSWAMPAQDRGKPCGLTWGIDNRLYVADTHEQRVSVFDLASDDPLSTMRTFGEYGEAPGQFIYPTDVALLWNERGAIERIYVSEYGGNDRVSAFDAEHRFLFEFGEPGVPEEGAVTFRRPQSVLVDHERRELVIADAGNHRIGRFTLDGELIAWIGHEGGLASSAPGEFSYPYGLALAPDGSVLVSEFGNSRVQRIDPETGACIGSYGVSGREAGELLAPWGVACDGRTVIVLDSANNRVQRFPLPARMSHQ
ncbi:MAG: hypothetical protein RLN60_05450 [Phycisphaerales bacterium]